MRTTRHAATRWVLVSDAAKASVGATVRLENDQLRHLKRVLRMEWDEAVHVLDGCGRVFDGTLVEQGDGGAVRLNELKGTEREPARLELVIALPKNATMDWVVEKAVECGATAITPIVSSRSVVKPPAGESSKYLPRWQAIMDGAVEQSERLWRPHVQDPQPWRDWFSSVVKTPMPSVAFVSEMRGDLPEAEALERTWRALRAGEGGLRVFIGPEGGLSEAEREELTSCGFQSVSLGAAVLRVETAVVSALTLARAARAILKD